MTKYELSDADRSALLTARELHKEMEILKEGLQELKLLSISVSSPNMDGMPKGQGASDVRAQTMIRIERKEHEIAALDKRLNRAKAIALRKLRRFSGAFRSFCEDYYVQGLSFQIAQAASGMSDRQCKNYMALVKGG